MSVWRNELAEMWDDEWGRLILCVLGVEFLGVVSIAALLVFG